MYKTPLILLISLMLYIQANGQCEPNAAYTKPGIYPDSASGFPPAVATYAYNLVVTAVIPNDTLFYPFGLLKVDSIGVHEVTGLPEGFQAIPSRPSGYWPGGTSGCMLITGTPSKSQVGLYPLKFTVVGYLGGFGLPIPYEITFYSIEVLDSVFFGVQRPVREVTSLKAYPNPFNKITVIEFYSGAQATYLFEIYDTSNRKMYADAILANRGKNEFRFDAGNFIRGMYFGIIRDEQNNIIEAVKLLKY